MCMYYTADTCMYARYPTTVTSNQDVAIEDLDRRMVS